MQFALPDSSRHVRVHIKREKRKNEGKNEGNSFFRLFPIISISQNFFSFFFLTLEQFFLTVR